MKNTIQLNKFGQTLGTRLLGIEARKELNELLFNENSCILLDFENVNVITNSFADELIGKKVQEMGISIFKDKVKIINVNKNIKAVIIKSIHDRMQ